MRDTHRAASMRDAPDDFARRRKLAAQPIAQWSTKRSGTFKTVSARF